MLCDHLQALSTGTLPERDLLINEPPGSSKSLICAVFWPAWTWTWQPWSRWLTVSYNEGLAVRDAVRTRSLMNSAWYQSLIQEKWVFSSDQNVKGYYTNNRTGWRIATSILGGVTGSHATYLLCDDPHKVGKESDSDVERQTVLTTWKEVFPSRVLPGGARVLIGQRVHEEDVTADWLERDGSRIHHIEVKEEFELDATRAPGAVCSLTGRSHDIRTYEGELLRPLRYGPEKIESRKLEIGPYAWSAQYQQAPTPRSGMVLDQSWFDQTPKLVRSEVDLIMAFDLNYSESATSDWTVGVLAAVERGGVLSKIHILDVLREHTSEATQEDVLGRWITLWKPIMVGIEKRAYERQGATMDLCRRLMAYCDKRGFGCNFEPMIADADKVTRAQIITGRAQAKLITVDRTSSWWTKLAHEMSLFPKSDHDDQIDALAYVVRLAVEKLELVRSKMNLFGHASPLAIGEAPALVSDDWGRVTNMGLR